MNHDDALHYEIAAARWCSAINALWWRKLWAAYLARLVRIKFARYRRYYPETPETADPAPPPSAWRLLPGHQLELGATGFSIHLSHDRTRMPYWLRDPEGRVLAFGGDLQGLKRTAESLARDRKEFQP